MARSFDGIKKLNPAEAEHYRVSALTRKNILLGEGKTKEADPAFLRRLDGLRPNKVFAPGIMAAAEEKNKLEQAVKKQELERKMVKEENRRYIYEKKRAEAAKRNEERAILEAEAARARLKAKAEAEKRSLKAKLIKKAEAEERRLKRRQAYEKIKKSLKNKSTEIFYSVKKNLISGSLILIAGLAVLYAGLALSVLRFGAANPLTEKLISLVPIPAAITGQGIINYNDYKFISASYPGLNRAEKKNTLASWLILENLKRKYGLAVAAEYDSLALKFIADENFNRTGLARINKIGALLKEGGRLGLAAKYADESGNNVYFLNQAANDALRQEIANLAVGQISGIILAQDGYYIVERLNDKDGQIGFNYLFVKALSLKQYLNEKTSQAGVLMLAD